MKKQLFGTTKEGREVFLYTLENKGGMKAEVIDYGAILVRLFVPDKNGVKTVLKRCRDVYYDIK